MRVVILFHAILTASFFLVAIAAVAVAGPLDDAAVASGIGDYATALRLWRSLADQGDARAQYNLGDMYPTATACRRTMLRL